MDATKGNIYSILNGNKQFLLNILSNSFPNNNSGQMPALMQRRFSQNHTILFYYTMLSFTKQFHSRARHGPKAAALWRFVTNTAYFCGGTAFSASQWATPSQLLSGSTAAAHCFNSGTAFATA